MGCPGGGSEKGNGNRILSERDVCSAGRGSRSVVLEASPVLLSEIMENGIRLFRTRFPAGMPVRFPVHDAGGLPGAGGRLLFLLSSWLAVCRWNGSWGICSGLILGACCGTCGRCWSNGGRRNGGGSFRVVRNLGCYAAGPVSRYEEGKSIRSSSGGMTVPFPGQRRTGDFSLRRKGRIISTNPVMRV